jgi:hypothetical protein
MLFGASAVAALPLQLRAFHVGSCSVHGHCQSVTEQGLHNLGWLDPECKKSFLMVHVALLIGKHQNTGAPPRHKTDLHASLALHPPQQRGINNVAASSMSTLLLQAAFPPFLITSTSSTKHCKCAHKTSTKLLLLVLLLLLAPKACKSCTAVTPEG